MILLNSNNDQVNLSRREFIKTITALGLAGALISGFSSSIFNQRSNVSRREESLFFQEANVREFYSICGACGAGCGIKVGVDSKGNLLYVTANPNHPQRSICGRGSTGKWLWNHPLRIKKPLKRIGSRGEGKFTEISWEQALDEIASKLKDIINRYGARSVVITRHDIRWNPLFGYLLGTPNFDIGHEATCHGPGTPARKWVLGAGGPPTVDPDYENARYMLFIGRTPATAPMGALNKVMKSKSLGSKIVVVDPRMPEIGYANTEWIPIIPGTDTAFVLSLIYVIINEKLYDENFLKNYTNAPFLIKPDKNPLTEADLREGGDSKKYIVYDKSNSSLKPYNEKGIDPDLEYSGEITLKNGSKIPVKTAFLLLKERASKYPPHEAERITGIPADTIIRVAREFALAKGVADDTWYAAKNGSETDLVRAILILNALVGNIDKRGGLCFAESPKFPDVCWIAPDGYVQTILGVKFESEATKYPRIDKYFYPETVSTFNAIINAVLEEKPYPVKALIVLGTTIFNRDIDLEKIKKVLEKLELIVVMDFLPQDVVDWADYVLPTRIYLEKEEIMVVRWTLHAAVQMSTGHVEPPPGVDARDELWIFMEILRRIYPDRAALVGYTQEYADYSKFHIYEEKIKEALIEALAKNWNLSPDYIKRELEEKGFILLKKKSYETRPYKTSLATPSGKVEIYQLAALKYNLDPLPDYYPPPAYTLPKEPNEFYLVNGKGPLVSAQGAFAYPMKYVADRRIWMNPKDAARLGVRDGDLIEIEGIDNGYKAVARVHVTNKVREKVLFVYAFMGGRMSKLINGKYKFLKEGINPNWFAKGYISPVVGGGATNSSVRVRKL